MAGRKNSVNLNPSEDQLRFREKRKWQIALRRYVVEKQVCVPYAPYFGLDIEKMRRWFEYQFDKDINWENFGKKWQFDHIIPVTYFDFSDQNELKLCWNFTNLRVENILLNKNRGHRLDVLAAKGYFLELYKETNHSICLAHLRKIEQLELSELVSSERQQSFIKTHREYLDMIANYSELEFELLNRGRTPDDVKKDIEFIKKIGLQP